MTLTVRSASVTGAATASRALTHAEMDENWNHVSNKLNVFVNVKIYGATGDGVTDDGTDIQEAIDALSAAGGGVLYFPAGTYLHSATLDFKANIIYQGSGNGHTGTYPCRLRYTGAGDNIQVDGTIDTPTNRHISVRDITIHSDNTNSGKGCVTDLGSVELEFHRVTFIGNAYGLILDQSELASVRKCGFNAHGTAGLWIVNGPDHTASASVDYTNRIVVDDNKFNVGTSCMCLVDDGGTNHTITNNNFNSGSIQLRIAGVRNALISGNEFEGCTVQAIRVAATRNGGSAEGPIQNLTISDNFFTGATNVSAPHDSLVDFETSSLLRLQYLNNNFAVDSGGANPNTTPASFVNWVLAFGNYNSGTGAQPFNNMNMDKDSGLLTYTPAWTDAGSPTLGDGTLVGNVIRNGVMATATATFTWGSSTAVSGSGGAWFISLPYTNGGTHVTPGTWYAIDSGGNRYGGPCYLAASDSKVQFLVDGSATSITGANPFSWANGDILGFSITYPAEINN